MAREKEIRFSSRTRQVSAERMRLRQEREAIRKAVAKLPAEVRDIPEVAALAAIADEPPVALVHLIYRANAWETGARDFEFSARTMAEHWQAGRDAVAETIAKSRLLAADIVDGKTAQFDLTKK